MINIHHIAINKDIAKSAFIKYGFTVEQYFYINEGIIFIVAKDYQESFNFKFKGKIVLEVKINYGLEKKFLSTKYPKFKEISNIIPKKASNHINSDGTICYTPYRRPIDERWYLDDFVSAVNSMIINFFSKKYIGKSVLKELSHGEKGLLEYEIIRKEAIKKASF